jgi:hypothetical protein
MRGGRGRGAGELVRGAVTGVPYEAPVRFCAHHSPAPQGRKPRGAAMPLETASLRAPNEQSGKAGRQCCLLTAQGKAGKGTPLHSAAGETSKSARPHSGAAERQHAGAERRPRGAPSYPSRLVGAPPSLSFQLRVPGRCRGQVQDAAQVVPCLRCALLGVGKTRQRGAEPPLRLRMAGPASVETRRAPAHDRRRTEACSAARPREWPRWRMKESCVARGRRSFLSPRGPPEAV